MVTGREMGFQITTHGICFRDSINHCYPTNLGKLQ